MSRSETANGDKAPSPVTNYPAWQRWAVAHDYPLCMGCQRPLAKKFWKRGRCEHCVSGQASEHFYAGTGGTDPVAYYERGSGRGH